MIARTALLGFAAALLALQPASAQSLGTQTAKLRLNPAEIAALADNGAGPGTSGVNGVRSTVLFGDPTRTGPYTIEIQVPPHTRIAAHQHRDDRTAVVISGLWNLGYGDTASDAATKTLAPGSFYTEPAGVAHFARTGDQPAVVYIFGYGPTDTVYTDPASTPPRP